jgi:uncharacterized membrane protein YfhO
MKDEKILKRWITYLAALGLPALIYMGVLMYVGNYPYGETGFSIWDMDLQYLDFFKWLKRVYSGEANIFYSFGKSLGDNPIGLYGFYLSSPFNLILIFFDDIQLFVVVLAGLKISFAGLACAIYIRNRFEKIDSVWLVLLSTCYALMSYNFKQISNIMWLDGAVIAPLLMLAVYKFIKTGKRRQLYITVFLSILSSWYVAYMCCLFSGIYFVYETIVCNKKFDLINILKSFVCYCATMILGVISTMFFFLPVIKQLLQGKGIEESKGFMVEFRCSVADVVKQLIPANADTQNSSLLILFCGTFVVVGIILFVISRKIEIKVKVVAILMLVMLVASAIFIPTENIWNGFRKVSSYYCRFSFVISFFMVHIAAAFYATCERKKYTWIVQMAVFILVVGELSYNANIYLSRYSVENVAEYKKYDTNMKSQIGELKRYDNSLFYRVDQDYTRGVKPGNYGGTYNEGLAYGFCPLASYSSTFNSLIVDFYVKCGYSETPRLIMHHEPILVSESLLGIKYLLGHMRALGYVPVEGLNQYNNKTVYENPYALSLGYMVDDKVNKKIKPTNSFEYQNRLISRMLGRDVKCFVKAESKLVSSDEKQMIWEVSSPKCKNVLYGYLPRRGVNKVNVHVNDQFRTYYSEWYSYKIFQISDSSNGEVQKVTMEGNIVNADKIDGVFYYLDMDEFAKAIAELKEHQMTVTKFADGKVKGDIELQEDGKLLLTIPYDLGWKAKVNGKKVKFTKSQDIFITMDLSKGKNHIELKYITPGLKKGVCITLFGMIIFVIWEILDKKGDVKNGREKNEKLKRNEQQ